jgi:hypothetical protein
MLKPAAIKENDCQKSCPCPFPMSNGSDFSPNSFTTLLNFAVQFIPGRDDAQIKNKILTCIRSGQ